MRTSHKSAPPPGRVYEGHERHEEGQIMVRGRLTEPSSLVSSVGEAAAVVPASASSHPDGDGGVQRPCCEKQPTLAASVAEDEEVDDDEEVALARWRAARLQKCPYSSWQ